MSYTVNEIAELTGVSTRTLRYYDQIDLLKPERCANGYRSYSQKQIDTLQQILFFRELGFALEAIKKLINAPNFDSLQSMETHLLSLESKKEQIDTLIQNVKRTIESLKGNIIMENKEKFEGFKKEQIEKNEIRYGKEIRERYGDKAIDAANDKLLNATQAEFSSREALGEQINELLKSATAKGDIHSPEAHKLCELHKKWIMMSWGDGAYSPAAHVGLAEMYINDDRFREYYENIVPGGAEFLYNAIKLFCEE